MGAETSLSFTARAVASWDQTVLMPVKTEVLAHVVVNSVFLFLALAVVILRLIARKAVQGVPFGAEDYLAIAATITNVGVFITTTMMTPIGSGYPLEEAVVNLPMVLLITFIMQPFYIATLFLAKMSMLFLYVRLFSTKSMLLFARLLMGFVAIWAVAHYLAAVFICDPVRKQYEPLTDGECGNQTPLFVSLISTNVVTDLVMMIIPIRTLWLLKLRKTEKVGIMASFSISIAIVVIGIFRTVYVTTVDLENNITGTMPISIFLTAFESSIAVICVSIPGLRPFYTSWRAKRNASRITESNQRSNVSQRYGSRYAQHPKQPSRSDMEMDTFRDNESKEDAAIYASAAGEETPRSFQGT